MMEQSPEKTKANRLLRLYLLNVKIAEPYHRVINRLFEFFNIDDSKDVITHDIDNFTLDSKKYNKKDEMVYTLIKRGGSGRTIIRLGRSYTVLLEELYMKHLNGIYGDVIQMKPFVNLLMLGILDHKNIKYDNILHVNSPYGDEE